MRRFTNSEKRAGEMAIRRMSEKAQDFYGASEPLEVYEYESESSGALYAISGCLGDKDGMTFGDLERMFEELFEEFEGE